MANRVGDYLKQDPLHIRFTSSNAQNGSPKAIIKRSLNQSVADITQTNYYSQYPNVILFYEFLDVSIVELETKKSLKLVWTGRNNKEEVSGVSVIESCCANLFRQPIHSFSPRRVLLAMWLNICRSWSSCNRVVVARFESSILHRAAERRES
jgi:hypothetical protein